MAGPIFGVRTGEVFLRNYDEGVIKTLGATLSQTGGGMGMGTYVLNVPGICAQDGTSNVPIVFGTPDQAGKVKVLPAIYIDGGDAIPAMQRWHSVGQKEYRVWVTDGPIVTGLGPGGEIVSGYTAVESKVQDMPFDITYTITIEAKFQNEANLILRNILRVFPPYSKLDVVDSLGDVRTYTTQLDGAVSRLTNVSDAADRTKGFTIGLLVEGELTLSDPTQAKTVTGFVNSTEVQ